jgi:hypothetical protein
VTRECFGLAAGELDGSAMDMTWGSLVARLVHALTQNTTGLCYGSLCSGECEANFNVDALSGIVVWPLRRTLPPRPPTASDGTHKGEI